jgi:hypothetical protein
MQRLDVRNAQPITALVARGALIALAVAGCGSKGVPPVAGRVESTSREARADPSALGLVQDAAGPKVIRSGELRIQVKDVDAAASRADSSVAQRGGLVTDRQQSAGDNGRRSAHLVVRVPADRFSDLMQNLKLLGAVKNEAVSQQDVTKAYFDVETRLAVKEQSLSRLRQMLTGKTARLADVLDVEREITRVVAEIEELKGQRRFYDNRIALSTIELTVFEEGALTPSPSFTVAKALSQSIEVLSTSLAWLVYLVTFLVPWVVVTGLVWWIVRRVRKSERSRDV